jgi:signal transduction histidine kinase
MSTNPKPTTGSMAVSSPVVTEHLHDNLRRLDRLASLGLIAASTAHEIKNGLVAINTLAEVLLEKSENQEMAVVARRELKRIDALVTQMLRFASHRPATVAPVHVHTVLDYAVRLLEHQMKNRQIALKCDYRAEPGVIQGDEAQLQQVFMNLMINAIEATNGTGELSVQTETVADQAGQQRLKIQISDRGCGIAPEHLPRVFEPFFTTKNNGTGLGLAICQRVAQEHQGYIEVQSELGCGSTFTIFLAAQ